MDAVEAIKKVGSEYRSAMTEGFGNHALARFIRRDLPKAVAKLVDPVVLDGIKVVASAGQGRWAESPWIALLHKDVTDSARSGFYPVFLFETGMRTCCLVLGQGAEALEAAYGSKEALSVLKRRAGELRAAAGAWKAAGFMVDNFDTKRRIQSATENSTDPWSSSVAFGARYNLDDSFSSSELSSDLAAMVSLYRIAIGKMGSKVGEEDAAVEDLSASGEIPPGGLDGTVKVVKHKESERRTRNGKLAKAAKKHHGDRCQGCALLPTSAYPGASGSVIEAHHLVPLSNAPKQGVPLTVHDFAVLCPTCHRIVHRLGCPPLADLKATVAQWLRDAHDAR